MIALRVLFVLSLCLAKAFAVGPDPAQDWRSLDTPHFRIHYPAAVRSTAAAVARIAEDVHPRIARSLDWQPQNRTDIVLLANADLANGFATPLPFNHAGIYLSPPDEGELLQNEDWLRLVITHEYVHIVHLDKVAGAPSVLRSIFGRVLWFFPNVLQPSWLIEGLAVWQESLPEQKIGRWRNSAFDAQMRLEVLAGVKSLREINASGRGFPLNQAYLYGAYFFDFLSERYGSAAPVEMIQDYSRHLIPFRVHNYPVSATGKQMDALWEEYRGWLEQRFAAQLAAIDGAGQANGEVLRHHFTISEPVTAADGNQYFVRGDGITRPQIIRRSPDGREEALRDVYGKTRLAAGPDGSLLAVINDVVGNYDLLGDLHVYTPAEGWRQVTTGARIRLAAWAPAGTGFVAVRAADTGLRIVRLDRDGQVTATLASFAAGATVSGIDLAPDGRELVWTQNRDRRWQLMALVSASAGGAPQVLIDDAAIKHSPRFSLDGRQLMLVADYGQVANVWALTDKRRALQRLTQTRGAVTGLARPRGSEILIVELAVAGDELRNVPLTGQGFATRRIEAPAAAPASRETAPSGDATAPVADRRYGPLPGLLPRAWLPSLMAADGALGLGVQVFGQDPVGWHQYNLAALYETTQQQMLGAVDYAYDDRHFFSWTRDMTVRATREVDDGDEISAYSIQQKAQWLSLLPYEKLARRLALGLGAAVSQERLIVVDGARQTLVDERLGALVLRYDSRTRQRLSEGPSQGQQATLFVESYDVFAGSDFSGEVWRFDWRAFVPAGPTVFALNYREGRADAGAKGFALGGHSVGADLPRIDLGERDYDLRAYRSGIASGRRVRVGSLEWRVPLADIDRHLMVPPVGLNRLSGNLFFETGAAWNDGRPARYFRAVGIEGLAELRLGYLLELQLRAGLAHGLDGDKPDRAYLTLGRAF